MFGIANGVLITLTGLCSAPCSCFPLTLRIQRHGSQTLNEIPEMSEYEAYLTKCFTAVLLGRLIPVIPAVVMNIVCGLSKVKWAVFLRLRRLESPQRSRRLYRRCQFQRNKLLSVGVYGLYMAIIAFVIYRKYPHLTQNIKRRNRQGSLLDSLRRQREPPPSFRLQASRLQQPYHIR
ncbi:VTT domain-containing protein [Bacillus licheniformis]|nr:VTT domain-containing protein [Bacillus licheniformis]